MNAAHGAGIGVLVIAETSDARASPLTRELLGLARATVGEAGCIAAALLASDPGAAADLVAHGADRVYFCPVAADEYEGEVWLSNVEPLAREIAPAAIWAGHTAAGAELAPRLAFRLARGVATACLAVDAAQDVQRYTRACYGGNARETIVFPSGAAVATFKPGAGEAAVGDPARSGEVIALAPRGTAPRVRRVGRTRDAESAARLEDAKVIVAGGRGLDGPEGFRVLEPLARALGGVLGASRVPCDLGWCPHSWQIGLTGSTVAPDLYVAVGISGAGHHLAGCGNARAIVAINTDPEAAIFRAARFGVVGDYRKIVPALTKALSRPD